MNYNLFSLLKRCRLESILAMAVSTCLLALFLTTRLFHDFSFGMHDLLFILLPVGVLGVRALVELLLSPSQAERDSGDAVKLVKQWLAPFSRIMRDWLPFLVLSASYYSLYSNLILRVNPHTMDNLLAKIDVSVFGAPPAVLLEPLIRPWLTDFFNFIYFSFVLYFPGVALYLYLRKQMPAFRRIMMGYLTLILMGVTSYLLIPAIGPGVAFPSVFTRDLRGQILSHGIDYIIQTGRVSHDCFPSLHVGIPLLLALYLRDHMKKLFWPAVLYVACMCGATIYLRYHYFIDVLAAFAYAPAAYFLNDFLLARWPGERLVAVAQSSVQPEKPTASPPAPDYRFAASQPD